MTLSNITDRGTLRGVIYRRAGSGTTDYTELSNKPQINGHTLQGNQSGDDLDLIDKGSLKINEHTIEGSMTGDDLGLVNSADLSFNVGHVGNILHNIKYKNKTYNAYADPFSGASSDGNGTMGLVPAPLSSQGDYNKFLKGNGQWANPNSGIIHTTIFNTKTNLTSGLTVPTSNFSNAKNLIFIVGVYASNTDQYVIAYAPLSILKLDVPTWVYAAASNGYGIKFRAIPSVNNDRVQFLDIQNSGWVEAPYIYQIIAES
jgi:hypothetical protein